MPNVNSVGAGFPFYISGRVVKGFGRGSKQLGIPTANIDSEVVNKINLNNGIYYGFSQLELPENTEGNFEEFKNVGHKRVSPIYMMCCSLGTNPYFQNDTKSLECHILHKFGFDFYGYTLRVAICGFIRGEKNFNSLTELINAIQADIDFTKEQLSDEEKWKSVSTNEFFVKLP